MRAAGAAAASTVMLACASKCSPASSRAGPPSKSRAGSGGTGARSIISHETIYRFIYAQTTRTKQSHPWRHFLPRAKWRRGRRRRRRSPAALIQFRRPLRERPATATDRQTPGHWEADLMLFRIYGQAVLTVHERHSRLLLAVRPPGKAAAPIAQALARLLGPLPASWRQTVTFDNGTEFARHHQLHALGIETFFCDPHAPWQKGGVSRTPSGACVAGCPARPTWRPCRRNGLRSWCSCTIIRPASVWTIRRPAEVFSHDVLHFKCESTFPLSRE